MKAGSWLALACCGVALGCADGQPCATDFDCGRGGVCVENRHPSRALRERYCRTACTSDLDCVLTLQPGRSCRLMRSDSLGPASIATRNHLPGMRSDDDKTLRGSLKVCLAKDEDVR